MMSIFYYLSLMGMLLIMANVALSQEEQPFCPRASEENPRCISHRYKKEYVEERVCTRILLLHTLILLKT